jgi:hypothetical protein
MIFLVLGQNETMKPLKREKTRNPMVMLTLY